MIDSDGYMDIEDLTCPKCGSEDFDWENSVSYPNTDVWKCKCCKCGHRFTVVEESFYKIEDDGCEDDDEDDEYDDVGDVTEHRCPHCGGFVHENNLYDPDAEEGIESYPYVCPECDENFYEIEVR